MLRRRRALAWLAVAVVTLAGCAGPVNERLAQYSKTGGYRYATIRTDPRQEELFVILAFSGGGTRAAAFSYGVLEALRDTVYDRASGSPRVLLDDVDVISSVSGGSFTAAYYALFGAERLADFKKAFLYRNIQAELALRALAPWNWLRLLRSDYSRIDLAADLYHETVFGNATFETLMNAPHRPYVLLNATDMTSSARFEFTQDQFDLLCSNLTTVPVARAVAASSAFPVLLSPLTLHNYAGGPCDAYERPAWLKSAIDSTTQPRIATLGRNLESYRTDVARRPFVHLLDGGLADNIGLRGPYLALSGQHWPWSVFSMINAGRTRRVVVITANAKTAKDPDWDTRQSPPGIVDVLGLVTTGPMGNYSFETVQLIAEHFTRLTNDLANYRKCEKDAKKACPGFEMENEPPPNVDFHAVELAFDKVTDDPDLRRCLEGLATSFHLPDAQVTLLREVARRLLFESPQFVKAMRAIDKDWEVPKAPITRTVREDACQK